MTSRHLGHLSLVCEIKSILGSLFLNDNCVAVLLAYSASPDLTTTFIRALLLLRVVT